MKLNRYKPFMYLCGKKIMGGGGAGSEESHTCKPPSISAATLSTTSLMSCGDSLLKTSASRSMSPACAACFPAASSSSWGCGGRGQRVIRMGTAGESRGTRWRNSSMS